LQAYEELTGPVLKYYANAACRRVDGTRAPAEVSREIETLLDQAVPVSV
jgi:adenylate kinase family enzyme